MNHYSGPMKPLTLDQLNALIKEATKYKGRGSQPLLPRSYHYSGRAVDLEKKRVWYTNDKESRVDPYNIEIPKDKKMRYQLIMDLKEALGFKQKVIDKQLDEIKSLTARVAELEEQSLTATEDRSRDLCERNDKIRELEYRLILARGYHYEIEHGSAHYYDPEGTLMLSEPLDDRAYPKTVDAPRTLRQLAEAAERGC